MMLWKKAIVSGSILEESAIERIDLLLLMAWLGFEVTKLYINDGRSDRTHQLSDDDVRSDLIVVLESIFFYPQPSQPITNSDASVMKRSSLRQSLGKLIQIGHNPDKLIIE